MLQQLLQCGVDPDAITFISAVDAKDFVKSSAYRPHSWNNKYWELTPTEIACFESHKMAWEMALRTEPEIAVVMEDDVIVQRDFPQRVIKLLSDRSVFDAVKLDYSPGLRLFGKHTATHPTKTLLPIVEHLPSAACYMVTANGCARLLQEAQSYCDHLDEFIWTPREHYNVFQTKDSIAIQGMFCSIAGIDMRLPNFIRSSLRTELIEKSNRGPVLFRLRKELRRVERKFVRKIHKSSLKSCDRLQYINPPDLADVRF